MQDARATAKELLKRHPGYSIEWAAKRAQGEPFAWRMNNSYPVYINPDYLSVSLLASYHQIAGHQAGPFSSRKCGAIEQQALALQRHGECVL